MANKIKFKKRKSTDAIVVVEQNIANAPVNDLRVQAKRLGDFDIGYHYVVYQDGCIGRGRDEDAPAGHTFPNCDTSIYVLVDIGNAGEVSDAAKKALDYIQGIYPDVKMMRLSTELKEV